MSQVIQLQGDQRKNVSQFLIQVLAGASRSPHDHRRSRLVRGKGDVS